MQGLVLSSGLLLAACSTLTPQVFLDRPVQTETAEGLRAQTEAGRGDPSYACATRSGLDPSLCDVPIATAIRRAEDLQALYIQAVKELSEAGTNSSAAILALSALGLFKGVTHPNKSDLAGIGVLGSATYAWSSTLTSRSRQQLFLTGAETLNCGIAATRQFALPAGFLGLPGASAIPERGIDYPALPVHFGAASPEARDTSVLGLAARAEAIANDLQHNLHELQLQNQERIEVRTEGRPASRTCQVGFRCDDYDRSSPDRKRAFERCQADLAAAQARAGCAGVPEERVLIKPPLEVAQEIKLLERQQRQLRRVAAQARQLAVQFGSAAAGNGLAMLTMEVQLKVSREVLQTEPNLASVLAAAQGLKTTAAAIGGTVAFAAPAAAGTTPASAPAADATGPAGQAHTSGKPGSTKAPAGQLAVEQRAVDKALRAQLVAAQGAREATYPLVRALGDRIGLLRGRLTAGRARLERCGDTLGAAALRLSPDVTDVVLAPGASRSFVVSGGTGTPQGQLLTNGNTHAGTLTRNLDGSFVYTAASDAVDESTVTLHFSDAAGGLSRNVLVRIDKPDEAATAAAASTLKMQDLNPTELAKALKAGSNSEQELSTLLKKCLKEPLGVADPDLNKIPVEKAKAVLAGQCNG